MTLPLTLQPEAEADLEEAFDWYEDRLPGLGTDFLLNVDAAFHAILRNSKQFPLIHNNLRRALVRRFPYQILFLLEPERVVVLAVFHARRNPRRWRARTP